jgi:DNA-directed RNA polymerase subunit alpha
MAVISLWELYGQVNEKGLAEALKENFGSRVRMSFSVNGDIYSTEIMDIDFSVRAYNCLKRGGFGTVGDVLKLVQSHKLHTVRNLSDKTKKEIKIKVLEYVYQRMTKEEKTEFLKQIISKNI